MEYVEKDEEEAKSLKETKKTTHKSLEQNTTTEAALVP